MINLVKTMTPKEAWRVAGPSLKIATQEDLEDMAYPNQAKILDYTGKGLALADLSNTLSKFVSPLGTAITKFNNIIPFTKPLLGKVPYIGHALTAYQILNATSNAPEPIENWETLSKISHDY